MRKGILYSGGYDSVALLHLLLTSEETDELVVIYEKDGIAIAGEYEQKRAKYIYDLFNKKYAKPKGIKMSWVTENVNFDWIDHDKSFSGSEVLLTLHLTTMIRHGECVKLYTGWQKKGIEKYHMALSLLEWIEKYAKDKFQIYFMEEFFKGKPCDCFVKISTIKYLLDNNIFHLPHSSNSRETIEEFKKRKTWFRNDHKEVEFTKALIGLNIFSARELSKIFKFKTTKQIQELYNSKFNKEERGISR